MKLTITSILSAELTRRLNSYRLFIAGGEMDQATANHRYLCLQTALWMVAGGDTPAIRKPEEEVREEIQRWIRTIQRESTVATVHQDGRVVALLLEFLEKTKLITAGAVQTTLI